MRHAHVNVRWLVFAWALLGASSNAQVTIPGVAEVNQIGAATYTVPISTPPGINGIAPSLALRYSSQGGNGPLGVGWSLDGISSITRCAQTLGQDGANAQGGINYSASDRFCLDGRRLLNIGARAATGIESGAPGVYGADGTHYSADLESFARIQSFQISSGGPSSGPAYFRVKTKEGVSLEYGGTLDSRVLALGKNVVRVWALNKIFDDQGNFLSITYNAPDSVNGQLYPAKIEYTGNNSISPVVNPVSTVAFDYQKNAQGLPARSDPIRGYEGGSLKNLTALLTSITTSSGGNVVSRYTLAYEQSPHTYRSRLAQLKKCDGAGTTCLPATNFKWNGAAAYSGDYPGQRFQEAYIGGGSWPEWWYAGDMNADGFQDIIFAASFGEAYVGNSIDVWILLNNGAGGFSRQPWSRGQMKIQGQDHILTADINGDGRSDIIHVFQDGTQTSIEYQLGGENNTLLGVTRAATRVGYWGWGADWRTGDFNGDGRPDLLGISRENNQIILYVYAFDSGAAGPVAVRHWATLAGAYEDRIFVADVNGDAKSDLIRVFDDGGLASVDFLVSQGSNPPSSVRAVTRSAGLGFDQKWMIADPNGDGLPDLVQAFDDGGQLSAFVYENTGGGALTVSQWLSKAGPFPAWLYPLDANGDGRSDLAALQSYSSGSGHAADMIFSTGSAYLSPQRVAYRSDGVLYEVQPGVPVDLYGSGAESLFALSLRYPIQGWEFDINVLRPATPSGDRVRSVEIDQFGSPSAQLALFDYQTLAIAKVWGMYSLSKSLAYPVRPLINATSVALQMNVNDSAIGSRRYLYRYDTGAYDPISGAGFLGYNWVQQLDDYSGLVQRVTYNQAQPFVGLPAQVDVGTGLASISNLSQTTYQYSCIDFQSSGHVACPAQQPSATACSVGAGKRRHPYLAASRTTANDLATSAHGATAMPGESVWAVRDNWGNELCQSRTVLKPDGTASGYSRSTKNGFAPADVNNWFIGRRLSTTSTQTSP